MRWRCTTLLTIAAVAFGPLASPARAQTQPAPAAPVPQAPRVGVAEAPLSITLADAVRMTLEQNNDVSIARLDIDVARENVRAAEGFFDPRVMPNFGYQRNVDANTSAIGGATEGRLERTEISGGAGMIGRTPWAGGRFTVDFSASRLDTSNQFARLNPEFPSALSATYVQPLARGRTIDTERRNILLARRAVDLTDAQLTQVVMDQLTLVEEAYWDLAFAARNLEVLTGALDQARTQAESNQRQVTQGTLAPIDVVEALTQVSRFEQAVASGQQALTTAENRLKRLILANRSAQAWNQPLVPADLADRSAPPHALTDAVQLALTRRPELKALDITRAQNDIDRTFFKNQTKPQVNVVGGYTLSGLAGDPLSSASQPPVGGDNANTALYARLNELSLIANLEPLDPPSTGTPARCQGSSTAVSADRSATSSRAAFRRRSCSCRWSFPCVTAPHAQTSRERRSPARSSSVSASSSSRSSKAKCATRCRPFGRPSNGSKPQRRSAATRSSNTRASVAASIPG